MPLRIQHLCFHVQVGIHEAESQHERPISVKANALIMYQSFQMETKPASQRKHNKKKVAAKEVSKACC